MKPSQKELCHALAVVGSDYHAIDSVSTETLLGLAKLGLNQIDLNAGQWELTGAGAELQWKLKAGSAVPELV
jgi:hypothetical protein